VLKFQETHGVGSSDDEVGWAGPIIDEVD
jgi:hypothetical protein